MSPRSSLHLKALCTLFLAVGLAASFGNLIAQEQASPLDLRHGYRIHLFRADGSPLSWDALQSYNGNLRWEVVNEKAETARGRELLEKGRKAGAAGDYATAIELFDEAHDNAPGWEYPVYEAAYTYLLMGNDEKSQEYYRRVNKLAPNGFFNTQQAIVCLQRELDGDVERGTYRRLVLLDRANPSTARLVARGIVAKTPDYAAAWERVAFFTEDPKKAQEAVDKGLAANPDPFTRDSLRMRRAIITHNAGDTAAAIRMLRKMLADPDLTVPVEAQIKIVLPGMRRSLDAGSQ